ncbi:MAG: TIGR02757 family protein [Balneolaceae bacterium]|nr:MAG: TIGR02757 family protein [Balneolaceae bacterium]
MIIRPSLRKRSNTSLLELKPYLDAINFEVEKEDYIPHDPVKFMHAFSDKKDVEIAGFLAATMAWGRRDIVIAKTDNLLSRMQYSPLEFVMNYTQSHFKLLANFKHRTIKPVDLHGIILALQNIYQQFSDFEEFWEMCYHYAQKQNRHFLAVFHDEFFARSNDLAARTRKHISTPEKGSTCKRLYMFLRWAIRKNSPVDPGIWEFMKPAELLVPFDVHVARQARKYGLITRRTNNLKTVIQLTESLRVMNPNDPAIYDYALFGMGALGYKLPTKFILNKV